MAKRPSYVDEQIRSGERASLIGNTWYLGRRSSRTVPGKKSPEAYFVPLAIAAPTGRREIEQLVRPEIRADMAIHEFGLSVAMKQLCPYQWKKIYGREAEMVFLAVVALESPTSYLLRAKEVKCDRQHDFEHARTAFWGSLPPEAQADLQLVKPLSIVFLPASRAVYCQSPTAEQQKIFFKYKIKIEMEFFEI